MDRAEHLFRRHANELFGYLCRMTGDRAEAEEILSDVFVRLLEQGEGRLADASFEWRPWLYRVATNAALSRFRRQRIRSLFLAREHRQRAGEAAEKPDPIEGDEEGRRVRGAIEKLGGKYRAVLLMRAYQEMSYEEIARALSINVGTVKSRLNGAKQRLARLLGGHP